MMDWQGHKYQEAQLRSSRKARTEIYLEIA